MVLEAFSEAGITVSDTGNLLHPSHCEDEARPTAIIKVSGSLSLMRIK